MSALPVRTLPPSEAIAEYARAFAAARSRGGGQIRNAMTVDVEDFFQVQAFAGQIGRADWESYPCRVEQNVDRALQLFADHGATATFFTLGWIAERYPQVVRRIVEAGHELASHGYAHHQVFEQSPEEFRADVRHTKAILEDLGQVPVRGYRAASFSIDGRSLWAFEILAEEGHRYSSSVYPVVHDLYGMPDAPRFSYRPGPPGFVEIPMTTVSVLGRNLPCSGGGYFRLFPYAASRWALNRVQRTHGAPCMFYFHPWELDPEQPRPSGISLKSRVRHYLNLSRMEERLKRLLSDFRWCRVDEAFAETLATAE